MDNISGGAFLYINNMYACLICSDLHLILTRSLFQSDKNMYSTVFLAGDEVIDKRVNKKYRSTYKFFSIVQLLVHF
jgi:hypothetical protein